MQSFAEKAKPEMEKAILFFEKEISKLRAGRASVSLVEDIVVDCFGSKCELKQLAAISIPEARQIVVQPWDKTSMEPIQKALSMANLGSQPIAESDKIRINLPPMSDEYRKSMAKMISEKAEEAKKTIRHCREEAWEEVQEAFKRGEVREDDKFRAKEDLQKLVDEYNGKVEKTAENKIKEITEN